MFSNFTPVYLFWYIYESDDVNFDDMGYTWNAGHVVGMISKNVALQNVEVRKARKKVMKSEFV